MCFIAGIVAGERRYISGEELREFFRVIGAITFLRGRDSGGIVLDTVSGTFSKKVSFHKKDEELEPPACVDILVKAAFMQTRAVPESA